MDNNNFEQSTTENSIENFSNKKPKNKKLIIISLILIAFLVLLAVRIYTGQKEDVKEEDKLPVNIKIATAIVSSIKSTSPISGRIQPVEEVSIIPMASGQIKNVFVKLGDRVSAGTVLFDIDTGSLGTSVSQASDTLTTAKTNSERMTLLYNEGAISLQQYEQAQSQLISAEAAYNSLRENLSNYVVTSPINGYITSLSATKGTMASTAAGPAATVADTSLLLIKTNVSEFLIGKINVGDSVEIFVKSLSDAPHKGTIKEIAPAPATGSLTYPIIISVDTADKEVKAGMFAEIKIVSDKREDVLCIPSDSVLIKQGVSQVAVLENKLPVFKEITTGLDNGKMVEVTSGLTPGDTIIIEGQHFVVEDEPVEIVE